MKWLEKHIHKPRNFLKNQFVYVVFSQRSGGLCFSINMNPDQSCNFNCRYCEVKRLPKYQNQILNIQTMGAELTSLLILAQLGKLKELPEFKNTPDELLSLKNVHLSGDGEPTQNPDFSKAVHQIVEIRQNPQFPFFKTVLFTNGTGLNLENVQHGLGLLAPSDEIWIKLDAGSQEYFSLINNTSIPIQQVLDNILELGRKRPIVIQSLFCAYQGDEPEPMEIETYTQRLSELKKGGAQIEQVQIYSVTRSPAFEGCSHLPFLSLSQIAQQVRQSTGLPVEVY